MDEYTSLCFTFSFCQRLTELWKVEGSLVKKKRSMMKEWRKIKTTEKSVCMCVSDQVTKLSEVPTDWIKHSQQDVDVGGVKLCRIWRMFVLGQNLLQLTYKYMNRSIQSLSSDSHRHIMKHNVSLIQAKHFLTYSEQWFTPSKSCIYTVVFYNPIFLLPNVWKQNHRYISRCIHQVCVIIMHAVWWELFMTRADAACARTMIPLL